MTSSELPCSSPDDDEFHETLQTLNVDVPMNVHNANWQNQMVTQLSSTDTLAIDPDVNDYVYQITSEYYTEEQFSSSFSPDEKDFTLFHLNIRSVNRNLVT